MKVRHIPTLILFATLFAGVVYLFTQKVYESDRSWRCFLPGFCVNDPALDTPARLVFSRGTSVKVEIADTSSKRIQGLSGRASLPEDRGLLFVFDTTNYHGIWMNKMLIPIDIIWLDDSFTVVSIKRDAVPESYPEVYRPSVPARYVLEVNAGFVAAHNILVGDRATIFEN